jgi:predicted TIM-barrel fold metal-dependent hydrolase
MESGSQPPKRYIGDTLEISRRHFIGSLAALPLAAAPAGPLVDTHIHLFDPKRFPYAFNAPYRPPAETLEDYVKFVAQSGITHTVIVQPEPYQDDHRYLEYCFAHEPSANFFKGTCLFDPTASSTPARMEALLKKHPGRIVALRIHEMRKKTEPALFVPPPSDPPKPLPPIKDRDMHAPGMKATWAKARALGIAIQMQFVPHFAPQIGELAAQFPDLTVILDHLGRVGQGTAAEFEGVLKLAKYPRVVMKYSGVEYASKAAFPHLDVEPTLERIISTFGADRMIWGGLGHNIQDFRKQEQMFELMFSTISDSDKAKVRGGNAIKLFKW